MLLRGLYNVIMDMAPALVLMGRMGWCNHVTHHQSYHQEHIKLWQRPLRVQFVSPEQCLGCLQCNCLDLKNQQSCALVCCSETCR